jgi:ATP-dependent Clp protease ATP-binding subunit ClpB
MDNNVRLNARTVGMQSELLKHKMLAKIVGQEQAIQPILDLYQRYAANMQDDSRPLGSVMMLGPTGTGKTRTVEALAESLVGDIRAVIKIDCGEFQHSHEVAKLVGSPPGYLGHRETHPRLSQEVLNQYHSDKLKVSFLLFDEIEKASDALWNIMLSILDKATLTLGDNRRVDFTRTMIFATSNLGSKKVSRLLTPSKLGFAAPESVTSYDDLSASFEKKITQTTYEAARSRFPAEFMNRWDRIVSFMPLSKSALASILEVELSVLQERVMARLGITFTVTNAAKQYLLEHGTDMQYGARHLKRTIDRYVLSPLANIKASGQIPTNSIVEVSLDGTDPEYPMAFHAIRARGLVASLP